MKNVILLFSLLLSASLTAAETRKAFPEVLRLECEKLNNRVENILSRRNDRIKALIKDHKPGAKGSVYPNDRHERKIEVMNCDCITLVTPIQQFQYTGNSAYTLEKLLVLAPVIQHTGAKLSAKSIERVKHLKNAHFYQFIGDDQTILGMSPREFKQTLLRSEEANNPYVKLIDIHEMETLIGTAAIVIGDPCNHTIEYILPEQEIQ